MGGMTSPANFATHSTAGAAAIDPHTALETISFVSAFLGPIGLLVSAGISLGDAALYWAEGNRLDAGYSAIFALIPGIGGVISKIPGVQKLGAKGMAALGKKLASSKNPVLTSLERAIFNDINKYAKNGVLQRDMNEWIRSRAAVATKSATRKQLESKPMRILRLIGNGVIKSSVVGSKYLAIAGSYKYAEDRARELWDKIYMQSGLNKKDDLDRYGYGGLEKLKQLNQQLPTITRANQSDATRINY